MRQVRIDSWKFIFTISRRAGGIGRSPLSETFSIKYSITTNRSLNSFRFRHRFRGHRPLRLRFRLNFLSVITLSLIPSSEQKIEVITIIRSKLTYLFTYTRQKAVEFRIGNQHSNPHQDTQQIELWRTSPQNLIH